MLSHLREHLLGQDHSVLRAVLPGYRCFKVRGRTYPGIIKSGQHQVNGFIIEELSDDDFAKLDHYEGLEYLREAVSVKPSGSQTPVVVQVYIYSEAHSENITHDLWNLSQLDIQIDKLLE